MILKEKVEERIKTTGPKRSSIHIKHKLSQSMLPELGNDENEKISNRRISAFFSERYMDEIDPTNKIYDFGQDIRFFELIQAGGPNQIPEIKDLLENDPKQHFYPKGHPNRLVNKKNQRHQTPLYIAVKNNNIEVVNLLINYGAEIKEKSLVDSKMAAKIYESNIELAARWGFSEVLSSLLSSADWSKTELKRALEAASSKTTKQLIQKTLYKKSEACVKCILM